jgi:hypothetical protein
MLWPDQQKTKRSRVREEILPRTSSVFVLQKLRPNDVGQIIDCNILPRKGSLYLVDFKCIWAKREDLLCAELVKAFHEQCRLDKAQKKICLRG